MIEEDFSKYNGAGTILRKAQLRELDILSEVDRICRKHNIKYWLDYGTLLGAVRHGGFIPWDDDIDISLLYEDYQKLTKILPRELSNKYVFQDETTDRFYFLKFAKVRDRESHFYDPLANPLMKDQGVYIDIFPIEKLIGKKTKKTIEYFYGNAFRRKRHFYNGRWKYFSGVFLYPMSLFFVQIVRLLSKISTADKLFTACGVPFFYEATLSYKEIFPCAPILFEGREFFAPHDVHAYLTKIYGNYMRIPEEKDRVLTHATQIELY